MKQEVLLSLPCIWLGRPSIWLGRPSIWLGLAAHDPFPQLCASFLLRTTY